MFSTAGRPYCQESDAFKLQTAKASIEAYEPFHSICFEQMKVPIIASSRCHEGE
jgi:hypothetical protein